MKFLLIFFIASSGIAAAKEVVIDRQDDCFGVAEKIKNNSFVDYKYPIQNLAVRYRLIKKFSAGKGGAYVALVKDKQSNENKVLKIFPTIKDKSNKYNFREIFYTCLNSFISYEDIGVKLFKSKRQFVFPAIFSVGMTNSADFDSPQKSDYNFPFMVYEFIKGQSLTALGIDAASDTPSNGFRFYKKDAKSASKEVKKQSESVLYQIVYLLHKLKTIKIQNKEYGFFHNDLNAGNVFVTDEIASGIWDAGFGLMKFNKVPIVTLIDFGHSSSNFDHLLGKEVSSLKTIFFKDLHVISGSMSDFYKNLTGNAISKLYEYGHAISFKTGDMRLYNVIVRALYESKNYVDKNFMKNLKSCKSPKECVKSFEK